MEKCFRGLLGRCHEWADRRARFFCCRFSEASRLPPSVFQVLLGEALPRERWAHMVLQMVPGGFKGRSRCIWAAGAGGGAAERPTVPCVRQAPGACLALHRFSVLWAFSSHGPQLIALATLPRARRPPESWGLALQSPSAFKDDLSPAHHNPGGRDSCSHLTDEKTKVWRGGETSAE